MTWLWVILIVGVIGGLIAYFSSGNAEDAIAGGLTAATGCGMVIARIFLAVLGIAILFWLFSWLFGGCS